MDGEEKFWITLWLGFAMCITIVAITAVVTCHLDKKNFVENGYEQVVLPGSYLAKWQKAQ